MAYGTGSGLRQGLGSELSRTLLRLESIASRPAEELGVDPAELSRLQYSLHQLGERLVGLRPPAGFAAAHAELSDALACARDATAALAEAAELDGSPGAAPLVYEWRGALFRLRLARTLLWPPAPALAEPSRADPEPEPDVRAALVTLGLTFSGGAAFIGGALAAFWPLWTAGTIAIVAGLVLYRPYPRAPERR
jgi:hypothetical protein